MNKKLLILMACATMLFAACDGKSCRCYVMTGNRWVGPETSITAAGTRCSSLNTPTRQCNELDDPIINPGDIAVGK